MNKKYLKNLVVFGCTLNIISCCYSVNAMDGLISEGDEEALCENSSYNIFNLDCSEPDIIRSEITFKNTVEKVPWSHNKGSIMQMSKDNIKRFNEIPKSDRLENLTGLLFATELSGIKRFVTLHDYFILSSWDDKLDFISEVISNVSGCKVSADVLDIFKQASFEFGKTNIYNYESNVYFHYDKNNYIVIRLAWDNNSKELMNAQAPLFIFFSRDRLGIHFYFSGRNLHENEYKSAPWRISLIFEKYPFESNICNEEEKKEKEENKIIGQANETSYDNISENLNINKIIAEKEKERQNKK